MSATKSLPNSISPGQPGVLADEGMRILKAQFASAALLPQKVWEAQLAMTSEILSFMGRRMQSQAEFYGRLARCKEIAEAVDAQQDFARGTSGAYADEAERLSALTRKNVDALSGLGTQYMANWMAPAAAA